MSLRTPLLSLGLATGLGLLALGCGDKDGGGDGGDSGTTGDDGATDSGSSTDGGTWDDDDADGDGYPARNDCDDGDASIHPNADELCNGFDDNCDGVVDTDAVDKITMYPDVDGDGYGNPLAGVEICPDEAETEAYASYVDNDLDCRDSDRTINPDGTEVCDEMNLDEDCDGLREDEDPDVAEVSKTEFFADYDLDGYGDGSTIVMGCDAGDIRSLNEIDCDDTTDAIGPDSTCAPWDGVWTGAVQFEVKGPYGYSGDCEDNGSISITDSSSTQVSGSVTCNWYSPYGYSYYPIVMRLSGSINYPWDIEGTWTDSSSYFTGGTTSFVGEFSADGQSLTLYVEGARDNWSGSYDLELAGEWVVEP
ncbi:MAG: putative metal-binding motif-containing protein [Alphaproteobacteria bacterium]|nr:putative metal-binding motif-containing protein [Alphaproteobacteria bacterium]